MHACKIPKLKSTNSIYIHKFIHSNRKLRCFNISDTAAGFEDGRHFDNNGDTIYDFIENLPYKG